MSGGIQKKKLKFGRNADGSLGAPKNVGYDEESLRKIEHLNKNLKRDETLFKKNSLNFKTKKEIQKNKKLSVALRLKAINKKAIRLLHKSKIINPKKYNFKAKLNKKHYVGISIGAVLLITVLTINILVSNESVQPVVKSDTKAVSKIQTNVKPDFSMLTPLGAGVDNLGGFAKISPEGSPPVYVYIDKIGDVPIKVSQQQLPDDFRQDRENKLKDLATQFNAKDPLGVGDFTAYVGKSAKGPQSVIYAKGNNLVLISSDNTVDNIEWIKYLGDLKY